MKEAKKKKIYFHVGINGSLLELKVERQLQGPRKEPQVSNKANLYL